MWVGLDDADEENGCVVYVADTKAQGIRPHEPSNVLGFSQKCLDYGQYPGDIVNEIPMVTAAGDLLAHHSLTVHAARANTSSNRSRRALGAVFFATRAHEDVAAKQQYQTYLNTKLTAERLI